MRLHVIANPLIPTLYNISIDAHSVIILRFCKLFFDYNHTVYFYGCDKNDVECTHNIPVINMQEYASVNFFDPNLLLKTSDQYKNKENIHNIFEENTRKYIKKNYKKGDIICQTWTKYKFDPDIISIDFMNFGGYVSDEYVVFSCYAWFYELKNMINIKKSKIISPWFSDIELINIRYINRICIDARRSNSFLFLARLNNYKGLDIYLKLAGIFTSYRFYIAGNSTSYENDIITSGSKKYDLSKYDNIKYLGVINGDRKYMMLSVVDALISPVRYYEPFGLNTIEAHICGTPVIASNIGGYTSTIKNNINGFLCNLDSYLVSDENQDYDGDLTDWINVLKNKYYLRLDKENIRAEALINYNQKVAYDNYTDFFDSIIESRK